MVKEHEMISHRCHSHC